MKNIRAYCGVGPMLVSNGTILGDAKAEGFDETKITSGAAQRSFIGITASKTLIMGTVPGVTVKQLAEIAKKMGCTYAMNLDGGASSSLYCDGKYITSPGRNLSNAIVVTQLKSPPIRLVLNGTDLFSDADPYFESNRIMLPMRAVFEAIGAKVTYDSATRTVKAVRGADTLVLRENETTIQKNGQDVEIDVPVRFKNSRTFVPVRFVIELFDGQVGWNGAANTATLTLAATSASDAYLKGMTAYNAGNYTTAVAQFEAAFTLDPTHAAAYHMAGLSHSKAGDKNTAITCLEKATSLMPRNVSAQNSLAWLYYGAASFDKAETAFLKLTQLEPTVAAHWIGLGDVYAHYKVQKYTQARNAYNKALTLKPTDAQKTQINQKLAAIAGK